MFLRAVGGLAVAVSAGAAAPEWALREDFRVPADDAWVPATAVPGIRFTPRHFADENAIEWQTRWEAPAEAATEVRENPGAAGFVVSFPGAKEITLHWSRGSHAEERDFEPQASVLKTNAPFELASFGGRSSDGAMPYFNLAAEGGGLVVALGWTGDWRASFEALPGGRVRVTAGLARGRLGLRAGERVRLPSTLVMAYRGDWIDGQNRFRRLLLRRYRPEGHDPMELMPVAASVHGMIGFNDTTASNLVALAADLGASRLPVDTFWLDAGWNVGGFPRGQGNPEADPVRYPQGLAPVGRAAREARLRFLVWFEPERVMRGTWLEREHPEWLLRPSGTPEALRYQEKDGFHLLDLGNPAARAWALEAVSRTIGEAGIGIYRQDFNAYPAYFWASGEGPDDAGRREVRYIDGLYAFLDALVGRHPGLVIDNCASGGRRLDFEMLRRSVALWRSDSCWDAKTYPRNVQAMAHGLSLWLPLHGLGAAATDALALRSGMGGCASYAINFRDSAGVAALRRHLERYLPVRALFAEDYYPLTGWSTDPGRWLAWQFHDPARNEGLVQAFRGNGGAGEPLVPRLRGLDPARKYEIVDWDDPAAARELLGADLMGGGWEIRQQGGAACARVFRYRAVP